MIHIFKVYTEVPEKVNELAAVIKLRDDMGVVRMEKPDQFILVCGGMSAVAAAQRLMEFTFGIDKFQMTKTIGFNG
jgi:hypothetical protein